MRFAAIVLLAAGLAGCAVNQGMSVVRTAHYDANGVLTGYTVVETLFLPSVRRPLDTAVPVHLFETGDTLKRNVEQWPPPRTVRRAVPASARR